MTLEDSTLFAEFPPVETSKWEELLPADLRGKPCFYRREDLEGIDTTPLRTTPGWEIAEREPVEGETVVRVGKELFREVARLRALRLQEPAVRLYAVPADPEEQLPLTVETLAAVLGGADAIAAPNDMARKVQLIFKHEALLDWVADPAAGSYYIETLTRQYHQHDDTL